MVFSFSTFSDTNIDFSNNVKRNFNDILLNKKLRPLKGVDRYFVQY